MFVAVHGPMSANATESLDVTARARELSSHRDERMNETFGLVLAAFFPGPSTFLRACHLGHHRRNRSEAERFDLSYPGESVLQKRAAFDFLYLGGFWLLVPVATVVILLLPRLLRGSLIPAAPEAVARVEVR